MARHYARAPKGQRALGTKPFDRGNNITILGALGIIGMLAVMTVNGGTDGDVFLAYVREVLSPHLRTGHIVIIDNLSTHKMKSVKDAIEATGARIIYLPAYSPDLSPIELCWSKMKEYLRSKAARTREELDKAIGEAINLITDDDVKGWFRHCGYCIQ